jgi:hypothetical protein
MRYKKQYQRMWSLAHKLFGSKTPRQVTYWARKMIDNPKVKVKVFRTDDCYSGLTIGGHYEPDGREKDIELNIHFNYDCEEVFFDHVSIEVFIMELFTTYVHERRHRYQYRSRGNVYGPVYRCRNEIKSKEEYRELNYYGDPDEIDAYALEAAIENKLRNTDFVVAKYRELFAELDTKVYNRFLKKRYKFLNRITL